MRSLIRKVPTIISMGKLSHSKTPFYGIFFFSVLVFLAHFAYVGKAVYGDGRYYFSYLPAFFIEHSLNLSKAFLHTNIPTWFLTPLHLPANIYPIGPALFWSIPYLLSVGTFFLFGNHNYYSPLLQIPLGIWTIALMTIGLYLLHKTLSDFFSSTVSLLTVLTLFFTTNLLFYGAVDVLNSHAITFFLSSLILYLWIHKPSTTKSLLIGILIGLLMLVRPQEGLFLLLPLSSMLLYKKITPALSVVAAGIVFLLQIVVWKVEWGSFFINPYLHVATFHFLTPHLWGVLFNHNSGLFLWTPMTLLATMGLILFTLKQKAKGIPMLLIFLGEIYLIASWSIWWEGASYSARMFISSLPFLAFGLAYLFQQKLFTKLKYFLFVFFSLFNVGLIFYFLLHK